MHTTTRRKLLAALSLGALLPAPLIAAGPAPRTKGDAPTGLTPYEEVTPPVRQDRAIVRLLFSYDCTYCRNYHTPLHEWGASLPAPFRFVATPILTDTNDNAIIMAIYGRLIAEKYSPKSVLSYDRQIFNLLQGGMDTGRSKYSPLSPEEMLTALAKSGVPPQRVKEMPREQRVAIEKSLPVYATLIKTYGLKETPSIAIGGRYLVTPDHAGGNPQQLVGLMNGIVSRIMEQERAS
mgnify:CR=1 FL=1